MKKQVLILTFLLCSIYSFSQQTYTVDGQTYELKTEVSGTLDLLWNVIDEKYRYFIKKGSDIKELKNTKDSNNKYQEEYKNILSQLTDNTNANKVKLTLPSLRNFTNTYNKQVDSSYEASFKKGKLKTRAAVFGGVTNVPFVDNPDNENLSQFFGELEVYDDMTLKSHSLFFRAKHISESDKLKYSTTQLGLGYRFKFINKKSFNIHANVTFATINFTKATVSFLNESDEIITREESATNFDAPLIFGLGADVRIADNIFVTLDYDELFAAFLDNQGHFSRHIALGIKFNL